MGYEKNKELERRDAKRGGGSGGSSGASGGKRASQFGVSFVNIDLAAGDIEQIKRDMPDDASIFASVERLAMDGYKITVSYDDKHTSFVAALTGGKECSNERNRGLCVTSRGPSMAAALAVALFKHFTVCEGGDWQTVSRTEDWG